METCLTTWMVLVTYGREWIHAVVGTGLDDAVGRSRRPGSLLDGPAARRGRREEARAQPDRDQDLRGLEPLPVDRASNVVENPRTRVYPGDQVDHLADREDGHKEPAARQS